MTFPRERPASRQRFARTNSLRNRPGISGSWQALIYFGRQREGVADDDATNHSATLADDLRRIGRFKDARCVKAEN